MEITWNDVKNGNPKKEGRYLVTDKFGAVGMYYYNTKQRKWLTIEPEPSNITKFVVAWAELPEPYLTRE